MKKLLYVEKTELIYYNEEEQDGELVEELPYEAKYFKKSLDDLENYIEINDEEGPEEAFAVQIICEQVKTADRNILRQIKIYYDETGPIEIISKLYEN